MSVIDTHSIYFVLVLTILCHFVDCCTLFTSHETQEWEYHKPRKYAREEISQAYYEGISVKGNNRGLHSEE